MKLIAASLLTAGCALSHPVAAQDALPAEGWRDDLRFLQRTVHSDYPFLFKKTTAEAFDAEVERLHDAIPELAPHEIVAGLARIVSSFEYGHTSLDFRHGPWVRHHLPVNLYHFSDGVYVEGVHRDHESMLGARVVSVEGVPIEDALAAIRPLVPAENDQFFKAHGLRYLGCTEFLHAQRITPALKHDITLTLEQDGETFDRTIMAVDGHDFPVQYGFSESTGQWASARDQAGTPLYLANLDRIYFFEHLPEQKTVYVRHSKIRDDPQEDIPSFYRRLFEFVEANGVERLVLDLRLNGGGNNYKNKPIVTGIVRCRQIDQPGRLFVIIGRRTYSACQNLVNELDTYTNAIFVGEPTAENVNFYGDNRQIDLPNSGLPVFLSFAWWQDKPQWENDSWTAPHIAIDTTFDDYRSNRDPALDAALAFTDDHFIRDPKAWLASLFQAGRLDELAAEAERIVQDPRYRFFDFEGETNTAGYELLNAGRVEDAIRLLGLNNRLFPGSANTWDSLAEAHWRAGHLDEAVGHYTRAIELDPDGEVGDNARRMLRQLEQERAP